MTQVNQKNEFIIEEELFTSWGPKTTDEERDSVLRLVLEELNLKAIRTNATKHGNTEIKLEPL